MPSNPRTIINISGRMTAFKEFKRRTGAWPVFSFVLHVARYVVMLAIISILFWYGRLHPDTSSRTVFAFLVVAPLFILLWTVLESVVWNYELRRKQLTSRGTFLTVKQFPGE